MQSVTPTSSAASTSASSSASAGASSKASESALINDAVDTLGAAGVEASARLARGLLDGIDLRAARDSAADRVDRFLRDGDAQRLPDALQDTAAEGLALEPDSRCASGRLRAVSAAFGRAAVNLAHCGARSLGSVALLTMAR